MKWLMVCMVVVGALMSNAGGAAATELVYTPINPSFGGNPLNGAFLLNQASAQNRFKEDPNLGALSGVGGTAGTGSSTDPVQQFKDQLDRMLLSSLADKLIRMAFGTSTVTSGDYTMGTLKVHVDGTTDPTNLQVTVTNIATGSVTTISLPVYQ